MNEAKKVWVLFDSNLNLICVHDDAARAEAHRARMEDCYPDYIRKAWNHRGYSVREMELCKGPFDE